MKTLLLMRHAEATRNPFVEDIKRNLTAKGIEEATSVAQKFIEEKISPDEIFCSPAERTKQTVEIITKAINCDSEKIKYLNALYDKTDIYTIISNAANNLNFLMILGHNPSISVFANYIATLAGESLPYLNAADFVIINFEQNEWRDIIISKLKIKTYKT